ncbi:MAG TPA: PEP-CTERM sorting domain-containing protein, partial [Alphaproteobacteria bacterium]|nr:PEP-CTERM sorting domain-containing protein [Alphaproteobacteria bacterium]
SGNDLVVANQGNAVIGVYNTSGSLLNSITTTGTPPDATLSGNDIFIPSPVSGISEYNTSGTLVNSFSTPPSIYDIGISGNDLFIPSYQNNVIGEYTTSGGVVDASLITGLSSPQGLAILGNDLFVINQGTSSVGEYTLSGGTVSASLITGLDGPTYIAVAPEPSTLALAGFGTAALWLWRRRK